MTDKTFHLEWFYKGECIRSQTITALNKHLAYDVALEQARPENWDRFHITEVENDQ